MSKPAAIQIPISGLDKVGTESFKDWMRLHRLDKQTVDKYLDVAREYSKTRIFSNTLHDSLEILQLDAQKIWKLTAAAMIWFFPSQHRLLEEVRDNVQLTINEGSMPSDWSYTYYSEESRTLVVGISFKNRPEDVLTVAHEYGHCVQLTSAKENFIPPLFREVCAFLAELIFLRYLAKFHSKLHMELVGSWYRRNNHYLGKCSKILCEATNIDSQTYVYEWNYPIARVFSIIAFDNMEHGKIWGLFLNFGEILERLLYFLKSKSHILSLSFLQPISLENDRISGYEFLGMLAFGEAFKNGSSSSKTTIKAFYERFASNSSKGKADIKVDHLMRPIFGERMIGVLGRKLEIARNVNIGSKANFYSSLGFAIELLSLSSYHKEIEMNYYIQRNFLPPLRHQQIKFYFSNNGIPIAFVTWARVSEMVMTEIQSTGRSLKMVDWSCGEEFFFNDFVSPYGCTKSVISDLKYNVVPRHCTAKSLRRNQNGSIRRVSRWVGRKIIESGDEIQKERE